MNLMFKLRESCLGEGVCNIFRKLVPPMVVWRCAWGQRVFLNLRDCLFYIAMSRKDLESLEGPVLDVLKRTGGAVWDVGCNVGFFSVYCAVQGRKVTAFDISEPCISLLVRTASFNKLNITTVSTALSTEPFEFFPPSSAHATNSIRSRTVGMAKQSLQYDIAARQYGIPELIKMDIEGAELDFFRSQPFKEWVVNNQVKLLVEVHSAEIWDAVWKDVPSEKLDDRHILVIPGAQEGS